MAEKPEPQPDDAKASQDSATTEAPPASAPAASESTGKQIGPYRIISSLGEGGMGTVYLAEQQKPVRREVALKVIKLGMDTGEVIARFNAERQALAIMTHPNVAKVLDAGVTTDGRPYFAMEYVAGIPITEYCDRHQLTVRDRLELFIKVCQGIQHAHQKGIIHRDVKPTNILVSEHDGEPVPSVIDFGIAKATNVELSEDTGLTQHGVILGTPLYMSPEQAGISGLDVDTRADIYSLGVLLYELLVGALPFVSEELDAATWDDKIRILWKDEATRPSDRLMALGDEVDVVATRRQSDFGALYARLRGDLDWVVMKAIEKDRTRRYESAAELAADIQRHLKHEPVVASPPSRAYRTKKFIRRHRVGVAAAALLVVLCVGFSVTLAVQLQNVAAEAERANRGEQTAEQVSDFMVGLFEVSDPSESLGNTITAREILDQGAERIETELADQPVVQARLMHTMGKVYMGLGLFEQAAFLLEQAVAARERELGDGHLDLAASLDAVGEVYRRQERYEKAELLVRRGLAIREKALGPEHPDVAASLHNLGTTLRGRSQYAEAGDLLVRAVAINEKALGPDHPSVALNLNNLAIVYRATGRAAEVEPLYLRALAINEKTLGPEHPNVAINLNNLAIVYRDMGRDAEAVPLYLRALAINEKALGPDHPSVALNLNNLAIVYRATGRAAEVEPLYLRALAINEKAFGPDHPDVARNLNNLGILYRSMGRYAEAEPLFVRALAIDERARGPEHPSVAIRLQSLAILYRNMEKYAEAEPLYLRALAINEKARGPDHPTVGRNLNNLGSLYRYMGRHAEAEPLLVRAVALFEKARGPDHSDVATTLTSLAILYRDMGRDAEADSLTARADLIRAALRN